MKRIGNLYEAAFTKEALFRAFSVASKHKKGKSSCYEFEKRLAYNIDLLHKELSDGSYAPKQYHSFVVYEPKQRIIYAPAFRDLVVQHAIYAVILPIFNRTFIDQSFACRPGKGTHSAADYAQHALQMSSRDSYTLKLDIRKFFYRIDREILRNQIDAKIKDNRFKNLMMMFANYGEPIGIPIGNLLSQLYALIYLNGLDHFVKRVLKIKLYCRYVDDFVLFNLESYAKATEYKQVIEKYISYNLNLSLSKFTIAHTKKGINFVGYRTWSGKRFIRKHSLYKFNAACKRTKHEVVASILGHAKRTHSLKYLLNLIKEKYHAKNIYLSKNYRRLHDLYC